MKWKLQKRVAHSAVVGALAASGLTLVNRVVGQPGERGESGPGRQHGECSTWHFTVSADPPADLALGDTIPVSPLHAVVSIGDVLLATAAALLVATAMHHPGNATREGNQPCPTPSLGSASR